MDATVGAAKACAARRHTSNWMENQKALCVLQKENWLVLQNLQCLLLPRNEELQAAMTLLQGA